MKKFIATMLALACVSLFGVSAFAQQAQRVNPQRVQPAQTAAPTQAPEGVVNINQAAEEELVRVPGIGPSRASAILALRQRQPHQQFRAIDDLLRVRGIGRVSLRRMRPYLALTGETTLQNRPGRTRSTESTDSSSNTTP